MEEMTAIDPLVTWIGCVAWLLNPVNDEGWDEKTAGKQVNDEGKFQANFALGLGLS